MVASEGERGSLIRGEVLSTRYQTFLCFIYKR